MSQQRSAVVLGAGVIGRATANLLGSAGFAVFGEDTDPAALANFPGETHALPAGLDLICVCVPTPADEAGMSTEAVAAAMSRAAALATGSARATLVAIRSTLMPGMFRELTLPLAEAGIATCYWPCFARERSAVADELAPRAVVIGADEHSAVRATLSDWLGPLACPVFLLKPEEAELAKAGANAFNALKISYFNAVGDWATERGGDGDVVANAVLATAEGLWNPAYGTRPGPAFGGACLPKDLDALIAALTASRSPHGELLRAARDVNRSPNREQGREPGA